MSKTSQDNRVLARNGARCLTEKELAGVAGGFNTDVCTISLQPPHTRDGDAC